MSDFLGNPGVRMPSTGFKPSGDAMDPIPEDVSARKPFEPWELIAGQMYGKTPGQFAGIPSATPRLDPKMLMVLAQMLRGDKR